MAHHDGARQREALERGVEQLGEACGRGRHAREHALARRSQLDHHHRRTWLGLGLGLGLGLTSLGFGLGLGLST